MNQETLQLENSTLANWIPGDGRCNAVAPEVLFMQRAVEWLKDGSRLGIVLPDGILGNPGDIVLVEQEEAERIRINGSAVVRTLIGLRRRKVPTVDNDLPAIAEAYREFRQRYPEPGS